MLALILTLLVLLVVLFVVAPVVVGLAGMPEKVLVPQVYLGKYLLLMSSFGMKVRSFVVSAFAKVKAHL